MFSSWSLHFFAHPQSPATAQLQINSTSRFESFALRCINVYSGSGILPSDTASQISMRSSAEWCSFAQSEKSRISRPALTCLETIHDTGATWLYHGQAVRLEWQSWHERSRIVPTCGLITSAMWTPVVAEGLGVVVVGTNCIPRKTKANKIEVSFASVRMRLR